MIDPAFYNVKEVTAGELADVVGTKLEGARRDVRVSSVASFGKAGSSDLSFVEKADQLSQVEASAPSVCLAPLGAGDGYQGDIVLIESKHPRGAFAKIAPLIVVQRQGWGQESLVHSSAQLEDGVVLAPNVVIGPEVKIGSGTMLEPGAVIGGGVTIGRKCRIGANTSISFAHIGDNVTILPGAAIGQAGFGLAETDAGLLDTPHFGRVVIQDNVSIGACVTIDRGLFDDTEIGLGAKIDNLSQIAHNVKVGAHVVMAAFAGVSGSVEIGQGVMMGGRAGIADHVKIGKGARLAAGSATMKDVPEGETWMGLPAKPIKVFFREVAWLSRAASSKSKS